jgi:hypothetical protein
MCVLDFSKEPQGPNEAFEDRKSEVVAAPE